MDKKEKISVIIPCYNEKEKLSVKIPHLISISENNTSSLTLPLLLKYRSKRLNNFAAYIVGGGKYVVDLASEENVDNATQDEPIVKTSSQFIAAEIGIGTDFFLPYFKFS